MKENWLSLRYKKSEDKNEAFHNMKKNGDSVFESIRYNAKKAGYNCRLCKYAVEYCRCKDNKCPWETYDGKTISKEMVRLLFKIIEPNKK